MTEEQKAQLLINELRMVDKEMVSVLYNNRTEPTMTFEECKEKWEDTVWHDVIMKRISIYEILL